MSRRGRKSRDTDTLLMPAYYCVSDSEQVECAAIAYNTTDFFRVPMTTLPRILVYQTRIVHCIANETTLNFYLLIVRAIFTAYVAILQRGQLIFISCDIGEFPLKIEAGDFFGNIINNYDFFRQNLKTECYLRRFYILLKSF